MNEGIYKLGMIFLVILFGLTSGLISMIITFFTTLIIHMYKYLDEDAHTDIQFWVIVIGFIVTVAMFCVGLFLLGDGVTYNAH